MHICEGLSSSLDPASWKGPLDQCLVPDWPSVSVVQVVQDFLERGSDLPKAVGDMGLE